MRVLNFFYYRCDDLISGVTKVLQSEGVSCCTVQPEMLPSSPTTNGSSPPVIHREIPSLPSVLACSRACGKNCAEKMCCSPPLEETRELLAPPAGETEEEPQTLVIENTFLWLAKWAEDWIKNIGWAQCPCWSYIWWAFVVHKRLPLLFFSFYNCISNQVKMSGSYYLSSYLHEERDKTCIM